jgi:hypothetical protein
MFAHLKIIPRGGDLMKPRAVPSAALYLIKLREVSNRARIEFRDLLTSNNNEEACPPPVRRIHVESWESTSTQIPLR